MIPFLYVHSFLETFCHTLMTPGFFGGLELLKWWVGYMNFFDGLLMGQFFFVHD